MTIIINVRYIYIPSFKFEFITNSRKYEMYPWSKFPNFGNPLVSYVHSKICDLLKYKITV